MSIILICKILVAKFISLPYNYIKISNSFRRCPDEDLEYPFRKILLFSLLLLSFSSAQAEENKKETLLFLPLDNRPVCSSYVAKTMEAAGYKVLLPPDKYLASYNRNGSPDELWKWLVSRAPQADAAVISTDSLIYGGLVASRTHHEPQAVLEQRLQRLETLRDQFPVRLYAFSTLMRTPRASFGAVEPPYYFEIRSGYFSLFPSFVTPKI